MSTGTKNSKLVTEDDFEKTLVRKLLNNAKNKAKSKGIEFSITKNDLTNRWKDHSKGRCEVTGYQFTHQIYKNSFVKKPLAPSLDKIEPIKGYVVGNVRLVCTIVNFALNDWGETPFREVIISYLKKNYEDGILEGLAPVAEQAWTREYEARIDEAERALKSIKGFERDRHQKRISGLKAAKTKGLKGSRAAAKKAHENIRDTTLEFRGHITDLVPRVPGTHY